MRINVIKESIFEKAMWVYESVTLYYYFSFPLNFASLSLLVKMESLNKL